jgi:hypothetical protein
MGVRWVDMYDISVSMLAWELDGQGFMTTNWRIQNGAIFTCKSRIASGGSEPMYSLYHR